MTKLVRKSQLAGLARTSAQRKADTALLVEAACVALPAGTRPSSVAVFIQGGGGFGLSAVSEAKRHLDIVKRHQAIWDTAHGVVAADSASNGQPDQAATLQRPADCATLEQLDAAKARIEQLEGKLAAALQIIDDQDVRHRRSEKGRIQLELELKQARAAPRKRLPKVYNASDGKPTSH